MVKEIISPEYVIDNIPGFEQYQFTASSERDLALPESIAYAAARNSTLQSAREAWAFRISTGGGLDASLEQTTRTAALYFNDNGTSYVAFDDHPDPRENVLLAQPQGSYDAHASVGKWLFAKHDPTIRRMLARAEQQRTLRALDENLCIAMRPDATGSDVAAPEELLDELNFEPGAPDALDIAAFQHNPYARAILGADLTAHVGMFLIERGYQSFCVSTLTPAALEQLGVDKDRVAIRYCGVTGVTSYMNYFDASRQTDCRGRARGVRTVASR